MGGELRGEWPTRCRWPRWQALNPVAAPPHEVMKVRRCRFGAEIVPPDFTDAAEVVADVAQPIIN
jgi:hypothetical protein